GDKLPARCLRREGGAHCLIPGGVRPMRMTECGVLSAAVLATVVLGGAVADAPPTPQPQANDKPALAPVPRETLVVPVVLPGGVTDAAGAIGYLTVPGGDGLVAVDLETGKVLWKT